MSDQCLVTGPPHAVTARRGEGAPTRPTLVNQEIPHNVPMPHKDMLYQAIAYDVDPERADELLKYGGVHPLTTQVPPTREAFSTIAVFHPAAAKAPASGVPP